MREWLVKQNTAALASLLVSVVTWSTGFLSGERTLRFLALLFLAHALVILFLEWFRSLNPDPEVGEILILDREDGRRTAQEVAFSSLLVYDSLVDILEYKGVATRKEVENRMEEVRTRYRSAANADAAGGEAPDHSRAPSSGGHDAGKARNGGISQAKKTIDISRELNINVTNTMSKRR